MPTLARGDRKGHTPHNSYAVHGGALSIMHTAGRTQWRTVLQMTLQVLHQSFGCRANSRAAPQRPATPKLSGVVNNVVGNMTDLQADLESRQTRGLPSPESPLNPTGVKTADVPMPATDSVAEGAEDLAKLLATAKAKLSSE